MKTTKIAILSASIMSFVLFNSSIFALLEIYAENIPVYMSIDPNKQKEAEKNREWFEFAIVGKGDSCESPTGGYLWQTKQPAGFPWKKQAYVGAYDSPVKDARICYKHLLSHKDLHQHFRECGVKANTVINLEMARHLIITLTDSGNVQCSLQTLQ